MGEEGKDVKGKEGMKWEGGSGRGRELGSLRKGEGWLEFAYLSRPPEFLVAPLHQNRNSNKSKKNDAGICRAAFATHRG